MQTTWNQFQNSRIRPQSLGDFEKAFAEELNGNFRSEWAAILRNPDAESFSQEALTLGRRLQRANQEAPALKLLQWVFTQAKDPEVKENARRQAAALIGSGACGERAEYLLSRFARDAADYRTIIPMIAGSAVGQLAESFALGRLASSKFGFFSKGLSSQITAGSFALALETPIFVASARALSAHQDAWDKDLARAAISLTAFKLFGSAAQRILPKRELAHQSAAFFGLLSAHRIEEALNLRERVADPTRITDALSALFAMGVGANLGRRALGAGFAAFQREIRIRTQNSDVVSYPIFSSLMETLGRTPALAVASPHRLPLNGFALAHPASRLWERQISLSLGNKSNSGGEPPYRENATPEKKFQELLTFILLSNDEFSFVFDDSGIKLGAREALTEYLEELKALPNDSPLFTTAVARLIEGTGLPDFEETRGVDWELRVRNQVLYELRSLLAERNLSPEQKAEIRQAVYLALENSQQEYLYKFNSLNPSLLQAKRSSPETKQSSPTIAGLKLIREMGEAEEFYDGKLEELISMKLAQLKTLYTAMDGDHIELRILESNIVTIEDEARHIEIFRNMFIGAGVCLGGFGVMAVLQQFALPSWPTIPFIVLGMLLFLRGAFARGTWKVTATALQSIQSREDEIYLKQKEALALPAPEPASVVLAQNVPDPVETQPAAANDAETDLEAEREAEAEQADLALQKKNLPPIDPS